MNTRVLTPKSVNIGKLPVQPLPAELDDKVTCTHCRVSSAHWQVGVAENYACSVCFLYAIPVLKEQREALDGLIDAVEFSMDKRFLRDEEGCLLEDADADRIVGGIVMAQRYEQAKGLR